MSRENIDLVREMFDVWNAGDMDAHRELHADDVILRNPPGWPEPGPIVGRDAVMAQFANARTLFDADQLEPVGEFIAIADRVAVRTIWHSIGRGSNLNMEFTLVFSIRRGKIREAELVWDHAEALEALGLDSGSEKPLG